MIEDRHRLEALQVQVRTLTAELAAIDPKQMIEQRVDQLTNQLTDARQRLAKVEHATAGQQLDEWGVGFVQGCLLGLVATAVVLFVFGLSAPVLVGTVAVSMAVLAAARRA